MKRLCAGWCDVILTNHEPLPATPSHFKQRIKLFRYQSLL